MSARGFLLDTHVVLWAAAMPERLRPETTTLFADRTATLLVSTVSITEMAIKLALGKLTLPVSPVELCDRLGLAELALGWEHATRLAALPPVHRDPFDRLLIAQALVEGLTLVTNDRWILQYDVPVLLA